MRERGERRASCVDFFVGGVVGFTTRTDICACCVRSSSNARGGEERPNLSSFHTQSEMVSTRRFGRSKHDVSLFILAATRRAYLQTCGSHRRRGDRNVARCLCLVSGESGVLQWIKYYGTRGIESGVDVFALRARAGERRVRRRARRRSRSLEKKKTNSERKREPLLKLWQVLNNAIPMRCMMNASAPLAASSRVK